MKSDFKKLPGSKVELEVVLTQDEFKPYWDAAYERAAQNVHLKGFRKGAAPKEMADAVIDKEALFEEAAREAIRWSLDDVTKEKGWTIIDAPKIEVQDAKVGITFKADLTIFPEVKLGDYKKIAKKIFAERKDVKIEQKDIDEALEWLRKSRSINGKEAKLDDEFAKSLGKFENLEALKKNIGEGVQMEKEYKETDRLRIKAIEAIIEDSKIDTPEVMVKKTEERLAQQLTSMLKVGGRSDADVAKDIHERAKKNVESNLILYKIAEAEKLDYNPEQGVESEKVFQFLESQASKQ